MGAWSNGGSRASGVVLASRAEVLDVALHLHTLRLHLLALARNLLRLARELCQDVVVVRVDALHQVLVQLVLQRVHLYGCMYVDIHGRIRISDAAW